MSRRASGLRAWFLQRATAIYLLLFFLYVLLHFITNAP
ncbi:MAG: succinate dehydrogenase, hydrophobic membrane anchor protein, partial [Candidatus Thiodiazotropha taylori]|nr:succinate dehydrogenase, hydrophobic membrane anchor protein [Candidatus Thiodiazotropha taylori]MCW4251518.1 succinate dehydrogenase, hydrophobic membrane anchor protein [Candidatus Thiodiazotropha taylori]